MQEVDYLSLDFVGKSSALLPSLSRNPHVQKSTFRLLEAWRRAEYSPSRLGQSVHVDWPLLIS